MISEVLIIAFGATASDLEWLKVGFEKMGQDTWALQLYYEGEDSRSDPGGGTSSSDHY